MTAKAFLLSHYSCSPPKYSNFPRRNFNFYSFYYTSGIGPFRYGEGWVRRNGNSWKVWDDVKSKPFRIADSSESLKFDDPISDALLRRKEDGDNLVGLPWWEEFPKRWVIVLLCFSAFLLCNMDRVNMSIAILPMASEFHWGPTTVGLIQSSFFWGYLLPQIAGGIWADTVGGKAVLGFGVVWWSVATVLTPIAANLGLPFELSWELVRVLRCQQ